MTNLLDLIIAQQYVVLPNDFSLKLSFKFPMPYLDNIPAASTYWFNLPTEGNNLIFKHANFIYGVDKLKIYDCILVVAGNHMKGKLYLKNAGHKEYKCFLVFNDIIEEISTKKISELVNSSYYLGADTNTIIAEVKALCQRSYPAVNYAFPEIFNDKFFDDKNDDFYNINTYSTNHNVFRKNYYSNLYEKAVNFTALVPMPYLFHVINEIFRTINYTVIGNFINDINFRKLIIYNNVAEENISDTDYLLARHPTLLSFVTGTQTYQIPLPVIVKDNDNTLINDLYHGSVVGKYIIKYKFTVNAGGQFTPPPGDIPLDKRFWFNYFDGSEMVNIHTEEILSETTYVEGSISFTFATPPVLSFYFHTIWPPGSVHHVDGCDNIEITIYPVEENFIDVFPTEFELKNHVPNLTFSDFLNNLIKKFSLAIFFDYSNKKIEIEHCNDIINNNNYLDLTNHLISNSEKIQFENKGFSVITKWSNDDLIKNNFKNMSGYLDITYIYTLPPPSPEFVNQVIFFVKENHYQVAIINEDNLLEWSFLTDRFYDIISNNIDVIEINSTINTLFSRLGDNFNYSLPKISQTGTTASTGVNDFGFKLLNYHGLGNNPYSSNNRYNENGNIVSGVNLYPQGEDGLYNVYAKNFYDYISSRDLVEMDFHINASVFQKIANLFKAGNPTRKIRVGARNYIPESVDITINRTSFVNCKIKLR